ncbi:MAG: cadherin-like beta sandwich domain-containing protein, partial [Paracoccaceae bacterium]|nr:cadherin-like beta sandwich domain-containing protein [Paracoccaceae bacterium]
MLRLVLALCLLVAASVSAAAACQNTVTFTSSASGATATLDVSGCASDIRSGLFDAASLGNSNFNNFPMHVDSTVAPAALPNAATFTLSDGSKVSVIPINVIGYYVDTYQFTLQGAAVGASGSTTLYYASGTDSGPPSFTFGPVNTAYPITVNFPAPAPTVTSISPTTGSASGGTSVVITGTGFSGVTAVSFGATAASAFTVNSATQITATAPAGSGTVDVRVTTGGGTSATNASDRFTYLSNVATLAGLSLSQGTLSPGFASGTTSYTASVGNGVTSLTVTPTLTDATASVKVNGASVASGSASGAIALAVGANTLTVAVTAQDGTTTGTYRVTVTRAASSVATLAGLSLSQG